MSKRDRRHLYFRDRKAWREWKASLPPLTNAKVVEGKLHLRLPNDFTVTPPIDPAKIMTFEQFNKEIAEPEIAKVYAPALDTDLDWVEKDKLDFMVEVEAGEPTPTRTAQSLLLEAAEIVSGDRERTHGKKERSFQRIAAFWQVYLADKMIGKLEPIDVAQMMVLLKIARTIEGTPVWDHFLDAAGYSGVAGEIFAARKGTPQ